MKKVITIFLLITICLSHLNLINGIGVLKAKYKKENAFLLKNILLDEEKGTEKENDGKSNHEKDEKFFSGMFNLEVFQLSYNNKFICYHTPLNIDPYQDDDIQPPKAV